MPPSLRLVGAKEFIMSQETQVTFLTQDAHDRLAAELNELSTVGRTEIAKRIEAAREEGDLKENGGYHAAKDEQGKIEARIVQLTHLLRSASVGAAPESHGVVEPGTVITATIAGDESTFLIGNREIAGNSDLSVYSEQSPLGSAILGLKVGESTSYTTPNGKEIAVTVTKVETYLGQ
jgi:transcription elongation factor GreA